MTLYAGRLLNCEQIKIIPSEWPLKLEIGSVLPDHMVAGSPSTATVDGMSGSKSIHKCNIPCTAIDMQGVAMY